MINWESFSCDKKSTKFSITNVSSVALNHEQNVTKKLSWKTNLSILNYVRCYVRKNPREAFEAASSKHLMRKHLQRSICREIFHKKRCLPSVTLNRRFQLKRLFHDKNQIDGWKHLAIQIFISERNKVNDDIQIEADDFYHELGRYQSPVLKELKTLRTKMHAARQMANERHAYFIRKTFPFTLVANSFSLLYIIDWWTLTKTLFRLSRFIV